MKMNPPASSSSPTSRKKPRIIKSPSQFLLRLAIDLTSRISVSASVPERPTKNRPETNHIVADGYCSRSFCVRSPRDARKRRNRLDQLLASSRAVREIQPHQN